MKDLNPVPILRIALTIILIYYSYEETGLFTAGSFIMIFVGIELLAQQVNRLTRMLKLDMMANEAIMKSIMRAKKEESNGVRATDL